jgi:hypothetical protein
VGPLFSIKIAESKQEISNISKPILFADDTSILLSHSNLDNYKENKHTVLESLNNWFKRNLFFLNSEKTHCIQFESKNISSTYWQINNNSESIPTVTHTKFLVLLIDSSLKWNIHIEQLVKKLSSACYAIRQVKPYMSRSTLLIIHYALFNSVMSYGIIFWGNSTSSFDVFKMQKRVVRIIMGKRN